VKYVDILFDTLDMKEGHKELNRHDISNLVESLNLIKRFELVIRIVATYIFYQFKFFFI
jgi:hypothetical protein